MKVLAITSRKGGSGKTSMTIQWGVEAVREGKHVALIDLDPQGSLSSWYMKRDEESDAPRVLQIQPSQLPDALGACKRSGVELVLIDTRPDVQITADVAVREADLVVTTSQPSPPDMEAIGATLELASQHNTPSCIVVTRANASSSMTRKALRALQGYGVPVCPVAIVNRVVYPRTFLGGISVGEFDAKSKAAVEVSRSWHWIQEQL